MVGCYILLYVKDELHHRVNSIKVSKVKTGFGGSSGNKGAVGLSFSVDDCNFAFINCHLSSD